MIMPLALLIPFLTPILTELVKFAAEKLISKVPHVVIPLLSSTLGAATAALAPLAGVETGVSVAQAGELGLAGTGVHQVSLLLRQWLQGRESKP
jgi:hypothetical protein